MVNYNSYKLGFEIEFIDAHRDRLVAHMQDYLQGSNIQVESEWYNHNTRNHWKIVSDATVSNGSYGGELVSPVLKGGAGLLELQKILEALNSFSEIDVDHRCGVHVHLSYDDMQVSHIQNIYKRYAHFEDTIDTWFPKSRRADSNRWCRSIQNNHDLQRVANYSGSTRGMSRLASSRYVKLNLQSLSRHGTIEFRQHAGSTDFEKISHWAKFCMDFVTTSKISRHLSPTTTFRPTTRKIYSEMREQFANNGYTLKYAGRDKWVLLDPEQNIIDTKTIPELDAMYIAESRTLKNDFLLWFINKVENSPEPDHVFLDVNDDTKLFLESRIAFFLHQETTNREVA